MDETRRVRVRAYRGHGLIGWFIRWQTRSKYAHLAMQYDNQIIESVFWHGVIKRDLTPADDEADVVYVDVPEHVYFTMLWWAQSHVGDGYDWMGLLRFISRRRWQHDDWWFCSEFGFANFLFGEIVLLAETEEWEVSPGLFMRSPVPKREAK